MPGWTYRNESDDLDLTEAQIARADAIAKRISAMDHEDEQEGFRRQREYEDGDFPCSYGCDEEPECGEGVCKVLEEFAARRHAKEAERELERDWLKHQLNDMGLRMMRAYEHWNEMERYYEMAESGNFPGLADRW